MKNIELIGKEFNINRKKFLNNLEKSGKDVVVFSELILREYKKKNKTGYVSLKAPKYILFLNELFKYFPNSKFIHIIRDGRDVSVSMDKFFFEQFKKRYKFDYNVKTWVVSINQGKKFRKNKNYIEIKYGDLIKDTYKTLSKISDFLNVKTPSKKDISNYYKKVNPKKIVSTHRSQVSQPPYKKSIGKWKKEMTPKQKRIFKKIAGKTLMELGYEK